MIVLDFCRATLCIVRPMRSCGVCPPVCHVRILYGNEYIIILELFYRLQPRLYSFSTWNAISMFQWGSPGDVECRWGMKNGDFRPLSCFISEMIQDRAIVTVNVNTNWYAVYRMVLFPMTLSGLTNWTKFPPIWSVARPLCNSWAFCQSITPPTQETRGRSNTTQCASLGAVNELQQWMLSTCDCWQHPWFDAKIEQEAAVVCGIAPEL